MMYSLKEVYITCGAWNIVTSDDFFCECMSKMPNLEIWMIENIFETTLYEEDCNISEAQIIKFLTDFRPLKSVLHTRNFQIECCGYPKQGYKKKLRQYTNGDPKIQEFLGLCCEAIDENFPVDTTEIIITLNGVYDGLYKKLGHPVKIVNEYDIC